MNEEEQLKQDFEAQDGAYRDQKTRFYNEIKKRGKKYIEGIRPLIEDGTVKVKDLTKSELLNCLNDAIGQYDQKQFDKSASANRKHKR